MASFTRI